MNYQAFDKNRKKTPSTVSKHLVVWDEFSCPSNLQGGKECGVFSGGSEHIEVFADSAERRSGSNRDSNNNSI